MIRARIYIDEIIIVHFFLRLLKLSNLFKCTLFPDVLRRNAAPRRAHHFGRGLSSGIGTSGISIRIRPK